MKLNELLMCQGVKRWHIVDTSRTQSVAEHSFNVAVIACKFMEKRGCAFEEIAPAVCLALMHDADEIYEGDIPAIAKKKPVLKENLAERAIQIADKLEAYWFAHHYAIGPRRRFVVEDTRLRFSTLVGKCDPLDRTAWLEIQRNMET